MIDISNIDISERIFDNFNGKNFGRVHWFLIRIRLQRLNIYQIVDALADHFSEYGVTLIQPWAGIKSEEKLGAVRIRSILVGHRQPASLRKADP